MSDKKHRKLTVNQLLKMFPEMLDEEKTELLQDIACQNCGNREKFSIEFTGTAIVDNFGSDDDGDHEWDAKSACTCPECGRSGIVKDFTFKGLDDRISEHIQNS